MAKPVMLMVHPSNELYGADRVLLESIAALRDAWDIQVWLPTDIAYPQRLLSNELDALGITNLEIDLPVFRRAYMKPKYLVGYMRKFFRTQRAIKKLSPDLVYINTSALAAVALVARLTKIPAIVHIHEYLEGTAKRVIEPLLKSATGLITVSHAITKVLKPSLQQKTRVVYNGFKIEQLERPSANSPLVFTVASRWTPGKGYEELLDGWGRIRRSDVELRVLGGPPPVGVPYDVRGRVASLRNSQTVRIVGEVRDIQRHLQESHAVIIPSRNPDPLPTIAIEANATGRAAIASHNKGGLSEIIEDDVTGHFFPLDDPQYFADLIEGASADGLATLGNAGRRRFERLFASDRYARDISEYFSRYVS